MEDTNGGDGRRIQSLGTALEIVDAIRRSEGAGVTELATELGYSKSTVHYYLKTMCQAGYLVRDGGVYDVGLRFLTLGGYALSRNVLSDVVGQEVDELAERTAQTALVAVAERGYSIYIYLGRSGDDPSVGTYLGAERHLHCTAFGKAILAHLPDDEVDGILGGLGTPAQTERTVTDEGALRAELAAVRDHGFAFADREYDDRHRTIASPIFVGDTGSVVGSVGIVAEASEVDDPRAHLKAQRFTEKPADHVRRTARVIGNRLDGP